MKLLIVLVGLPALFYLVAIPIWAWNWMHMTPTEHHYWTVIQPRRIYGNGATSEWSRAMRGG